MNDWDQHVLDTDDAIELPVRPLKAGDWFEAVELLKDGNVVSVQVDGISEVITRANVDNIEKRVKAMSQMDPEFLRAEAERMLARAAILEQVQQGDPLLDGQVLYFEKAYGGKVWKYAAIKADELWFVTGQRSPSGVFWNELVNFIGVANLPTVKVLTTRETLFDYVRKVQKALEEEK